MKIKAYRLRTDSPIEPEAKAGMVVVDCGGYDYGVASDDTRAFGRPHRSVTLKLGGGYPFFSHPEAELEPLQIDAPDPPEQDHVQAVCKPGSSECCKYLTMTGQGWSCAKLTTMAMTIESRTDMRATGDNCPGRGWR